MVDQSDGSPALWTVTTKPEGGIHGSNRRVILVHGTLDRSAGLGRLARRLGDEFTVTRYDRRGYGKSVDAPGARTVAANVADLVEIIESESGSAVLFGHSFGGNVCLAAAQQVPDRVDAVFVYESPLSWRPGWESSRANPAEWDDDPAGAAEAFMRRLLGDRRWERLPAQTRADRRAEGATMIAELNDLASAAPWEPERLTVPVVPMFGETGAARHRRAMEWIAAHVATSASAVQIDGANHFGPNTAASAVAEQIRHHLTAMP